MLAQIDNDPGYVRVARALETEIICGRLKLGEALPTEAQLSVQLGVHRSTVREGIRSLENSGLVRRGAGKRLIVSAPEPEAMNQANSRALRLMRVSFAELWEVQMQLEPLAARLAAEHISPELEIALKNNVADLRKNLDDDDLVIRSDIEFHQLIAAAAQNAVLSLAAAPIGTLLLSATIDLYATVKQARHRLLEAHEAILEAVLSHDGDECARWMVNHIQDFKRGYETGGLDMTAPLPMPE